jgi:hypothetical protein
VADPDFSIGPLYSLRPIQLDLPLSEFAREYCRSGWPSLQRCLPFWMAALTAQLLVSVVGVLYPLFRLLPAAYGWSMRWRIVRVYGELKLLEAELEAGVSDAAAGTWSERLDGLEQRVNGVRVPTAFAHMLYTLEIHIGLARARLQAAQPAAKSR